MYTLAGEPYKVEQTALQNLAGPQPPPLRGHGRNNPDNHRSGITGGKLLQNTRVMKEKGEHITSIDVIVQRRGKLWYPVSVGRVSYRWYCEVTNSHSGD